MELQQKLWETITSTTEDPKFAITEINHPFRHDIIGKSKEALLNRRPYVAYALESWKQNKYNATSERVAYNVNYFEIELKIVDKELMRFNKIANEV